MPYTPPAIRIPNLPFFYLVYRAWSHWRALSGGKHIQFLLTNNLLTLTPSPVVDDVYAAQTDPLPSSPKPTSNSNHEALDHPGPAAMPNAALNNPDGETMLLSQANGKKMTKALDLPQLEVELERAIWQVEAAMAKHNAEGGAAKATAERTADQDADMR